MLKAVEQKLSMNEEFVLANPLPIEHPTSGGDDYSSKGGQAGRLPNPDVLPHIVRLAHLNQVGESLDDEEDLDGNGLELGSESRNADNQLENEEDETLVSIRSATSKNCADSTDDDCSIHESDQSEESEPNHVNEDETEFDGAMLDVEQPTLIAAQPLLVDHLLQVDPSPKCGRKVKLPEKAIQQEKQKAEKAER